MYHLTDENVKNWIKEKMPDKSDHLLNGNKSLALADAV